MQEGNAIGLAKQGLKPGKFGEVQKVLGKEIFSYKDIIEHEVFSFLVSMFYSRGYEEDRTFPDGLFLTLGKVNAIAGDNEYQFVEFMAMKAVGYFRISLYHPKLEIWFKEEGITCQDSTCHAKIVLYYEGFVKELK